MSGRKAPHTEMPCTNCGATIERPVKEVETSPTGRFFCSAACRNQAGGRPSAQSNTTCQQCGETFYSKPSARRKFCSLACSRQALATIRVERTCEECGVTFTGVGRRADNRFCSRTCSGKQDKAAKLRGVERAPRETRQCAVCGTEVRRRKSDIRTHVFCSRECYGRGRSMRLTGTEGFEVTINDRTYWANKNTQGYAYVYVAERRTNVPVHRLIMEQILGRYLLHEENVHHINGVRDDNRPENLELWNTSQPSGQRVADKVRWATDILRLYTPEMLVP